MSNALNRMKRVARALLGKPRSVPPRAHPSRNDRADSHTSAASNQQLCAALDAIAEGVILLDAALRVQFVNRAFRALSGVEPGSPEQPPRLEDLIRGLCGSRGSLPERIERNVGDCVANALAGIAEPLQFCLADGELIQQRCSMPSEGGRVLVYRTVTDHARQRQEIEWLRAALSEVDEGIVLLDEKLRARFINRAFRGMADLLDEFADSKPSYVEILEHGRRTNAFEMDPAEIERYMRDRLRMVRDGVTAPMEIRWSGGRRVRARIVPLPEGGRLLTYTDIATNEAVAPALAPN